MRQPLVSPCASGTASRPPPGTAPATALTRPTAAVPAGAPAATTRGSPAGCRPSPFLWCTFSDLRSGRQKELLHHRAGAPGSCRHRCIRSGRRVLAGIIGDFRAWMVVAISALSMARADGADAGVGVTELALGDVEAGRDAPRFWTHSWRPLAAAVIAPITQPRGRGRRVQVRLGGSARRSSALGLSGSRSSRHSNRHQQPGPPKAPLRPSGPRTPRRAWSAVRSRSWCRSGRRRFGRAPRNAFRTPYRRTRRLASSAECDRRAPA